MQDSSTPANDEQAAAPPEQQPTTISSSDMPEITLEDVADTLSLTIKHDHDNKLITFLGMLSAYTDSSQLNVSFNAPSSSGKTYMATEVAKLFPDEDKIERSGASPTSFFHAEGKSSVRKGQKVKIVDLERKILLFYEQPNPELQKRLRAVLSHDQRELTYSITNKIKGKNQAEQIIIRGFPATTFCSAGLRLDEQEATRAILLSPQVTDEKLKEGVHLQALRGSNEMQFDEWLESQPERIALKRRIIAIRDEHVNNLVIDDPEYVEKRFKETFKKLKPRHMRDMGHLIKLIKAIALLNVWHRRKDDGTIVASKADIDSGFELWNKVIFSQDLNVPPAVLEFYLKYVLPIYFEKLAHHDNDIAMSIRDKTRGITRQEISSKYLAVENAMLNDELLRKQFLPQLENSGLITQEKPTAWGTDQRSMHIMVQWIPSKEQFPELDYIGEVGGTDFDIDDPSLDEAIKMFFGKS